MYDQIPHIVTVTNRPTVDQFANDWLRIVQPPWPDKPNSGFLGWLHDTGRGVHSGGSLDGYFLQLNSLLEQYRSHCESDGCVEVELHIKKSRQDLAYDISASYGELSQRYMGQQSTVKKSITVKRADHYDLEANVATGFSATWEGTVYDADGVALVPVPEITLLDGVLYFGQVVSGVIRLNYVESHDTYYLTIVPRPDEDVQDDDKSTAYQSTVMAVWGGGVVVHDVDIPEMTGNCTGARFIGSDGEDDEECVELRLLVNPCSLEKISETVIPIQCPEEEESQ